MQSSDIVHILESRLPELADRYIRTNTNISDEAREQFLANPDSRDEHQPKWHQWGIITHTLKFREFYDEELPEHLEQWNLTSKIKDHLLQKVDDKTRGELLRIAIPLHDIGKFSARTWVEEDGKFRHDFDYHDEESEHLVLTDLNEELRTQYGLSMDQIGFIAKLAGNHYGLGYVRKKAKNSKKGYTPDFTQSPEFRPSVEEHLPEFAGIELEIGLMFLADNFAKTDIIIPEGVQGYKAQVLEEIQAKGLPETYLKAVEHRPINTAVGREYLKIVLNR